MPFQMIGFRPAAATTGAEFPRIARSMARLHALSAPRAPMSVDYEKAIRIMRTWSPQQYVDDIEATDIRCDERWRVADAIANFALRRDERALNAMMNALESAFMEDGGTGMTEAKLHEAACISDRRPVL
jgi:hypothetical protein